MTADSLYSDDTNPAPKAGKSLSKPKSETTLDRLKEVISTKVERPAVLLEVPSRPGVKLRISPNINQNQIRAWRRNSGEDTKAGMDSTKFACYVIGHSTVGILMDDEEVLDDEGNRLNFASDIILTTTETSRPVPDAVRAFFGVDPHLESAALAILDAAGYSDTVETEDPTKGSSTN
jgi:hypothetical protein